MNVLPCFASLSSKGLSFRWSPCFPRSDLPFGERERRRGETVDHRELGDIPRFEFGDFPPQIIQEGRADAFHYDTLIARATHTRSLREQRFGEGQRALQQLSMPSSPSINSGMVGCTCCAGV